MPHVVRCGSHQGIDGIPKGALEVVPHHPVVCQDLLRSVTGQAMDLLPVGGRRMTVIGIPPEGQRARDQTTSRLPNRALVPELILLVLLPLRDALNLRLMQTVYLILVASLLIDHAQVQFKVLPVLLLLERIHLPGNIVHHGLPALWPQTKTSHWANK